MAPDLTELGSKLARISTEGSLTVEVSELKVSIRNLASQVSTFQVQLPQVEARMTTECRRREDARAAKTDAAIEDLKLQVAKLAERFPLELHQMASRSAIF